MNGLPWLTHKSFTTHIFCLLLLFNSMVLGCFLQNSTQTEMEKTENDSWNISSKSIGLNRYLMWSGSKVDRQWIVKVPYTNRLEPAVNKRFLNMVNEFQRHSCIRWVPRTNERQYVRVHGYPPQNWPADRCMASIGKGQSITTVYLSQQCLGLTPLSGKPRTFNVAHEMFHSLNFVHEHQRKDRDCYVQISGNAVRNDFNNYGIYRYQDTDLTFPFDEESIMQYPDPTIRSKFNKRLGPQTDFPDKMDWMKLNYHYCRGKHYCDQQDSIANQRCHQHRQIQKQCYRKG